MVVIWMIWIIWIIGMIKNEIVNNESYGRSINAMVNMNGRNDKEWIINNEYYEQEYEWYEWYE